MSAVLAFLIAGGVTGCSTLTPTYETQEAYVILDGAGPHTQAHTEKLLNDITRAMKSHVSSVVTSRSVPAVPLPRTPGSFTMVDPTGGKGIGAIIQANGMSVRSPHCEQPIMTLKSVDRTQEQFGQRTQYFVCVMPYATGYRTAIFASYTKASGGVSLGALGGTIGSAIVGDTSQFIPRVMDEVKRSVQTNLTGVTVVQSYIPESFSGPLVSQRQGLQSTQSN